MASHHDKIAIFIDGTNIHLATKALGFEIDYKLLLQHFQERGNLVRASYYTVILEDQEFSSIRPLADWLAYNGFHVVSKPAKEIVDSIGQRRVKRNMDIEIVVDAMELAPSLDEVFLFSGDGGFRALVVALQRQGVRVTVVSTVATVAAELRRQADDFMDLKNLQLTLRRDPATRPARTGLAPVPDV